MISRLTLENIVAANYRKNEISFGSVKYSYGELSLNDISFSDISTNYRFNAMPIHAIFCQEIDDLSHGQSAIFDENRLHYFCTILYFVEPFLPWTFLPLCRVTLLSDDDPCAAIEDATDSREELELASVRSPPAVPALLEQTATGFTEGVMPPPCLLCTELTDHVI